MSEVTIEELVDQIASVCYTMYKEINVNGAEMKEIMMDTKSFKALVGGYLYLYEKHKGIDKPMVMH